MILADALFGQTFDTRDLFVIAMLIVLEGVLSIDNALVLGILAKRLPKDQRKRALTYGLVGAFVFRLIAIATATFLLKWTVFKLFGGLYLIYIAVKHFFFQPHGTERDKVRLDAHGHPVLVDEDTGEPLPQAQEAVEAEARAAAPGPAVGPVVAAGAAAGFWKTVFVIEMTDIAFAIDSIVAAIGVVGPPPQGLPEGATHPKLWVVVVGGILGVVLMRFAAVLFIKLLERFPRFELAAYLLVVVIGLKLVIDWGGNRFFATPQRQHPVDFHDPKSVAFWVFWVAMVACFAIGFIPKRKPGAAAHDVTPAPEPGSGSV